MKTVSQLYHEALKDKTYAKFQAALDAIDAEISDRQFENRSAGFLYAMRDQLVLEWNQPAES